jgi:hypothetical protein
LPQSYQNRLEPGQGKHRLGHSLQAMAHCGGIVDDCGLV